MNMCEWCDYKDNEWLLYRSLHWSVYLADVQDYVGRCILVLNNKNKMIDGVCAGIAEYFNIDPTLVRLGAVVLTCAGGSGVLAYIICAIIVHRDPNWR